MCIKDLEDLRRSTNHCHFKRLCGAFSAFYFTLRCVWPIASVGSLIEDPTAGFRTLDLMHNAVPRATGSGTGVPTVPKGTFVTGVRMVVALSRSLDRRARNLPSVQIVVNP